MNSWFFFLLRLSYECLRSDSESLYAWRFKANHFILARSPVRLTTRFFFQLNIWFSSPAVTSSLMRVWVCCLQLLLASPAQSFSGPIPAELVYRLKFEIPPTWRARSPYLYLPGTGWHGYAPRHQRPFSSLPTTRRATVEVFDPSSTPEFAFILVCTAAYIVSGLHGKCWLLVCIHGNLC
jgi:hypothetical protein